MPRRIIPVRRKVPDRSQVIFFEHRVLEEIILKTGVDREAIVDGADYAAKKELHSTVTTETRRIIIFKTYCFRRNKTLESKRIYTTDN